MIERITLAVKAINLLYSSQGSLQYALVNMCTSLDILQGTMSYTRFIRL